MPAVSCPTYDLIWSADSCRAIVQGKTFNWLTFLYPSDVTTWTPRGQIRRNFADIDLTVDASFSFDALTYGAHTVNGVTSNYTTIRPILSAIQTQALTATKRGVVTIDGAYVSITGTDNVEKRAVIGTDIWVYEIEIESPSAVVVQISQGLCQVLQEVAR